MAMAASKRPASAAGRPRSPGLAYIVAIVITVLFIAAGTLLLPKGSTLAVFLFDYSDKSFLVRVYPFTIQNAMYLMMAVGLADLWVRHAATQREQRYVARRLLPEKDTDILLIDDLGAIRRTVSDLNANEDAFLPQLIDLSILQLFTSRSLEQTVEIYTSTLELMSHRLDLAYQTMRFLVWVIPTTGFIGTVVGISIALEGIQDPKNISFEKVTSGLAVAFYTTAEARIGGRMWDIFSDLWHLADKPHGFFIASATLPRTEPKPFDQAPAEDVAVIEAWPECLPQ